MAETGTGCTARSLIVLKEWAEGRAPRDVFIGISEEAFAHYVVRKKDGVKVLREIGVTEGARRKGYGSALLGMIGLPLELKTDEDNEASNAFYQNHGFKLVGKKRSRDGKRIHRIYRRLY